MFFKKIATYDKVKFPQQANSMVGGTRRNGAFDNFFLAYQTENYINFNPTSTKIAKSYLFKKVDIRQNRTNLTTCRAGRVVAQIPGILVPLD